MEISLKTQKDAAWKCDTREKQSFPSATVFHVNQSKTCLRFPLDFPQFRLILFILASKAF